MTDLEFAQKCASGDKHAWEQFVAKYSRLIYSYIFKTLHAKNRAVLTEYAPDIFQDIAYSLVKDDFRKLKTFQAKNGCSLASWLRQVTINFVLDYLRRLKPAVSLDEETQDGFSLMEVLSDNKPDARQIAGQEEVLTRLKECIEWLSISDKYFLELHIYQGVRLEDLKEMLRLSRGAIDMQKSRITSRLRECFKSKGFPLE